MKKLFWVTLCLFLSLMIPAISFSAAPGPYLSGQIGMSFMTDSDWGDDADNVEIGFDPGLAANIAVGYNLGMGRIEAELGYQKNDVDELRGDVATFKAAGDVSCISFLVNGYFDFVNASPLTPYLSVGIGGARVDVNNFNALGYKVAGNNETVYAFQVGAGVAYAINKNLTLDLKYRYFGTEDVRIEFYEAEIASHNVYLGLRYNF